jgi:hypothetical protein
MRPEHQELHGGNDTRTVCKVQSQGTPELALVIRHGQEQWHPVLCESTKVGPLQYDTFSVPSDDPMFSLIGPIIIFF